MWRWQSSSEALRSRGWNGHFIGVDVSEQVIEVAKKSRDNNAEWHVSAIEDFPIPDKKVNIICLCESIYYVKPNLVPALLERCRQSLSPQEDGLSSAFGTLIGTANISRFSRVWELRSTHPFTS